MHGEPNNREKITCLLVQLLCGKTAAASKRIYLKKERKRKNRAQRCDQQSLHRLNNKAKRIAASRYFPRLHTKDA